MKKDKQQSSFVNIGSSSLLVIFLVLCLVTFAILSVSSAKSDYSFSERLAAHKKEYYDASARAERITGEIDDILVGLVQENGASNTSGTPDDTDTSAGFSTSAYVDLVKNTFDGIQINGTTLSCSIVDEEIYISYQVPAGEKQVLDVLLLVTDYTKEDTYYQIAAWQIIPSENWEGDESLNLMPVMQ